METKKLRGGKFVGPALAATTVASADEPADVGQGVIGWGSKLLNRVGGAAALLLHSKGLNEGEDADMARMREREVSRKASGGSVSSASHRADGIAQRGRTRI